MLPPTARRSDSAVPRGYGMIVRAPIGPWLIVSGRIARIVASTAKNSDLSQAVISPSYALAPVVTLRSSRLVSSELNRLTTGASLSGDQEIRLIPPRRYIEAIPSSAQQ